jgi:hypothetical protein
VRGGSTVDAMHLRCGVLSMIVIGSLAGSACSDERPTAATATTTVVGATTVAPALATASTNPSAAGGANSGVDTVTITASTEIAPGCEQPQTALNADAVVYVARSYIGALVSADPAAANGCLASTLAADEGGPSALGIGSVTRTEATAPSLSESVGYIEVRAYADRGLLQRSLDVSLVDGVALITNIADVEPLWTQAEAEQTAIAYYQALGASDWQTAAALLDAGGANVDERSDLAPLFGSPPSNVTPPTGSLADRLRWWCVEVAADCSTSVAVARSERVPYGWGAVLNLASGREVNVPITWFEGTLGVSQLPLRTFSEPDHAGVVSATPGLVAFWRLETDGLDAVNQLSLDVGTAVQFGQPALTASSGGSAAVNGPVSIPDLGRPDMMTLNVWTRLPAANGSARVLVSSPTFQLWMTPGGEVGYTPNWSAPTACDGYPYGPAGAAGSVAMITMVVGRSTCELYVNGRIVQGEVPRTAINESLDAMIIGEGRDGDARWGGDISDLAIWNRALTVVEIAALFESASR